MRLDSQKSSSGSQPFVFLEQAKSLLNEQRIQDARSTLQRRADLHPKDKKITHLLRAISPGRVTNVEGTAPNRSKEVVWIQRHGNKYREQWIAINDDDLLATATCLNTLFSEDICGFVLQCVNDKAAYAAGFQIKLPSKPISKSYPAWVGK